MLDDPVSAFTAWNLVQDLLEDERVEWISEPPGLDSVLPTLLKYSAPSPQLVGDAYLAAFAIAGSYRLVTWDGGFKQFQGLELELLSV
jgi:hypothetical protein